MSIYTKTGDHGTTSLVGGQRIKKYHPRVEAYGTVDELNACLAVATHQVRDPFNHQLLLAIQHQLFWLGAELADDRPAQNDSPIQRVGEEQIADLEHAIDRCMAVLPPVTGFVLPGDSIVGSQLHLARTVARRTERLVVRLAEEQPLRGEVLRYLNRLSDCLYALARSEDHLAATEAMINEVVKRYRVQSLLSAATQVSSCQTGCDKVSADNLINNATLCRRGDAMEASQALTTTPAPDHVADAMDFHLVHSLMRAALDAARELALAVVIAIVDRHGNLVMTYRMPDALLVSLELAPKKAFSAVALKTATHDLGPAVQPGADLYQLEAAMGGKIVTFGGGYPLYRSGLLIGGLGISGGSVAQDRQIAQRAITQCHVGNE
jgi:ATP:cob(I)alamin adenosyltransferase